MQIGIGQSAHMSSAEGSLISSIENPGVHEVARRYVEQLVAGSELDAISLAIWSGDDDHGRLPASLLWNVLIEIIHQCPDDDRLLWQIGDGPIDNNCIDSEIKRRLFLARDSDPKVLALFQAMRRMLPTMWDVHDGGWFD